MEQHTNAEAGLYPEVLRLENCHPTVVAFVEALAANGECKIISVRGERCVSWEDISTYTAAGSEPSKWESADEA